MPLKVTTFGNDHKSINAPSYIHCIRFHPISHQDIAEYLSNFRCRQEGTSLLRHSFRVNPQIWDFKILPEDARDIFPRFGARLGVTRECDRQTDRYSRSKCRAAKNAGL